MSIFPPQKVEYPFKVAMDFLDQTKYLCKKQKKTFKVFDTRKLQRPF